MHTRIQTQPCLNKQSTFGMVRLGIRRFITATPPPATFHSARSWTPSPIIVRKAPLLIQSCFAPYKAVNFSIFHSSFKTLNTMGVFFLHSFVPSWRNCLTPSSFHQLGRAADYFSGEPLWCRAAGQGGRKHSGDNWFVLPCNFHIHFFLCLSIFALEVLSISISLFLLSDSFVRSHVGNS